VTKLVRLTATEKVVTCLSPLLVWTVRMCGSLPTKPVMLMLMIVPMIYSRALAHSANRPHADFVTGQQQARSARFHPSDAIHFR
jgi:hypothetical protein